MGLVVRYLWASPATLVGLVIAGLIVAVGGTARFVAGVLECTAGPLVPWLCRRCRFCGSLAITFGHVVLATDQPFLERYRAHERVHVSQYERWGLLFFPLYLFSSLAALVRGYDPYTSNHFEQGAFKHPGLNPVTQHSLAAGPHLPAGGASRGPQARAGC